MSPCSRFIDPVKCFYFNNLLLKVSVKLTCHTVLECRTQMMISDDRLIMRALFHDSVGLLQ